mgnify:FL=1
MSILKVDTINEKTSDNGVHIAGHIIQMQSASFNGNANSTSGSSFTDTDVTINITPKFATSKMLVIVHQCAGLTAGSSHTRCDFRCIESNSSTEIYRMDYHGQDGVQPTTQINCSGHGFFQCSNTNQLTFKTQVQKANASSGETTNIYQNWYAGSVNNITVLEIAQ